MSSELSVMLTYLLLRHHYTVTEGTNKLFSTSLKVEAQIISTLQQHTDLCVIIH